MQRHHRPFHVLRIDVEARDVDHVIGAGGKHQHAGIIQVAEVAGVDFAFGNVDMHCIRGAVLACGQGDVRQRAADVIGVLQILVDGNAAGLGTAVLLEQIGGPAADQLEPGLWQYGARGVGGMEALAVGQEARQRVQHCRRRVEQRMIRLAQAAQDVFRVQAVEHHRHIAAVQRHKDAGNQPVGMGDGAGNHRRHRGTGGEKGGVAFDLSRNLIPCAGDHLGRTCGSGAHLHQHAAARRGPRDRWGCRSEQTCQSSFVGCQSVGDQVAVLRPVRL